MFQTRSKALTMWTTNVCRWAFSPWRSHRNLIESLTKTSQWDLLLRVSIWGLIEIFGGPMDVLICLGICCFPTTNSIEWSVTFNRAWYMHLPLLTVELLEAIQCKGCPHYRPLRLCETSSARGLYRVSSVWFLRLHLESSGDENNLAKCSGRCSNFRWSHAARTLTMPIFALMFF